MQVHLVFASDCWRKYVSREVNSSPGNDKFDGEGRIASRRVQLCGVNLAVSPQIIRGLLS